MKLVDALEILQRPAADNASRFSVSLACGFEPLHLRTFLAAELIERLPRARVEVGSGTFDDLVGNVARAGRSSADAIAVVIEWPDIDPRLGLRRLGGWSVSDVADIVEAAALQLERLEHELANASGGKPIAVCPPTLPLPPLFAERPVQSGAQELRLRSAAVGFAERLGRDGRVTVCSLQRLDECSPPARRRDVQAELSAGFPYSVAHASAVAALLATLIAGATPRKGLITDLDDTLWAGIAGEVGAENVSWGLDSASQRHGLYQQLLASLASAGVLIGAATRNDSALVAEVLGRADLLISADAIFPVEVGWGPKSVSIERILEAWNVAADAVVVVDDDPLELDAARDAFPGIEAVQLPGDDDSLWRFLTHLRELFGKDAVTDEDRLRLRSIRSGSVFREHARSSEAHRDDFLARASGAIEFSDSDTVSDRALELINKTNQFNLNGERHSSAALDRALGAGASRLITASYEDRYGPLGTVVALVVSGAANELVIDSWVMSCRAFARRLEHHCLRLLFDRFEVDEIKLAYRQTNRNAPVGELLTTLTGAIPEGAVRLTRKAFDERAPALVHRVAEAGR
jgi:FkbH-like protein